MQKAGRVDEIAFDFDGIVFDFGRDDAVRHSGVINAAVAYLHIVGEVFADKAVEKCAENVLFKVPAIHRAAYFVGDFPNLAVQLGALLHFGHHRNPYIKLNKSKSPDIFRRFLRAFKLSQIFQHPFDVAVDTCFDIEKFFLISGFAQFGDVGLGEALVFAFERVGKGI